MVVKKYYIVAVLGFVSHVSIHVQLDSSLLVFCSVLISKQWLVCAVCEMSILVVESSLCGG